jgi:hypothetical protein
VGLRIGVALNVTPIFFIKQFNEIMGKKRRENKLAKRESKFGINPVTGQPHTKKSSKKLTKWGLNEDGTIGSKAQHRSGRKNSGKDARNRRMDERAETDQILARDYGLDARGDRIANGLSFATDAIGIGASALTMGLGGKKSSGDGSSYDSGAFDYASDNINVGAESSNAYLSGNEKSGLMSNPIVIVVLVILSIIGIKILK